MGTIKLSAPQKGYSVHRCERLGLKHLTCHITDIVPALSHIELHHRGTFAQVTLRQVDIEHTGIGHHIEIVTKVADIGERTPLCG